jgi:drug/metabolite transporter (DMT)-like permease
VSTLSSPRAYAALLVVAVLWGTFPATTKLALDDFPPLFLATVRCLIAAAFLVVLVLRSGAESTRGLGADSLRAFAVLGFTGLVVSMQGTYIAIAHTTAANAAILQPAAPVMVALGARLYLGERLRRRQWLGIAVSALGVLLIVTDGGLGALRPERLRLGDFLALAALVGWSAYTIYGKEVLVGHSPLVATAAAYVAGTAMLVPLAVASAPVFPPPRLDAPLAWTVLVYHALFGAVAHIWWYKAVDRVGASRSAIFMNVTPIVGILLAGVLVGERIGPWHIAGATLVLAGVALTTGGQARPRAPRRQ